jgi:tetraacyldisaccharide 4'-kinase
LNPLSKLTSFVEKRWYGKAGVLVLLAPLEYLFKLIASRRKQRLLRRQVRASVPVIVVGNLTVGGTGKTPTIIALVEFFQSKGLNPAVISRGYGRQLKQTEDALQHVTRASKVEAVGDEPLLIFESTGCEVVVSTDRLAAITYIEQNTACDLVLADDGLQHYQMGRDKEIVVIDRSRLFGNEHLLPVGPLREPLSRLQSVDWVLLVGDVPVGENTYNGDGETLRVLAQSSKITYLAEIRPVGLTQISTGITFSLDALLNWRKIMAVAGLGNPHKFFNLLRQVIEFKELNLYGKVFQLREKTFADHHPYSIADFDSEADEVVVMTSKDAVKCRRFAKDSWYQLDIKMVLAPEFLAQVLDSIHPNSTQHSNDQTENQSP